MNRSIATFVVVQVTLVAALASAAAVRWEQLRAERALPELREEPLSVLPTYDVPVVVSDEQLTRVLRRMGPVNRGPETKLNHIDHALRCWDVQATFANPRVFSGEQMRELLTDNRVFERLYGRETPPLLIDHDGGVRVRVQEGNATSSHVDHTMATLAEVGTPLSFPLVTPRRETTYRAMVEQSLRDFSLNQVEYEWSALTFALFMPPARQFVTTEGQAVTFDAMARRIMREQQPDGVCFGNHRLHALVMFLRVDEQTPILAPEVRAEVMDYLRDITRTLAATQHADGYWDGNWPHRRSSDSPADANTSGNPVVDRILATGHPMEWWALAPAELHPPRHVLAAAGQWLSRTFDDLSDEQIEEYYTYLTHAARALALWRGKLPYQVPHD